MVSLTGLGIIPSSRGTIFGYVREDFIESTGVEDCRVVLFLDEKSDSKDLIKVISSQNMKFPELCIKRTARSE
jgi:hypothetical protein